jgi:hypothetical protein
MRGDWGSDGLLGLSVPAIAVVTFSLMFIAAAVGQFVRRWQDRRAKREQAETECSIAQEGYLLGSVLGLLGLLLAFTFGMALNRFETRRELVIQEANAIGTAYLRTQLLDEPFRGTLSRLLVTYAENRVSLATASPGSGPYLKRNDQLLTEIWSAVKASRESAHAHGLTTVLLATFNEVIDLDAQRKIAWNLRVPIEVLFLLIVYLGVTATVVGHQVDGPRGKRAALVMFLMVSLSITVVADLNRPMSGHARESQEPMIMLLASLKSQPPTVFDHSDASSAAAPAPHN